MNVDPTGHGFFTFLIATIITCALFKGISNAAMAVENGASDQGVFGSFFSGLAFGAAMGVCLALGAAAGVGIMGFGMAFSGSLIFGAAGGLSSYMIESAAYGQSMTSEGMFKSTISGFLQGGVTSAFSYLGGRIGFYGNFVEKGTTAYFAAMSKGLWSSATYTTMRLMVEHVEGLFGFGLRWFSKAIFITLPVMLFRAFIKNIIG